MVSVVQERRHPSSTKASSLDEFIFLGRKCSPLVRAVFLHRSLEENGVIWAVGIVGAILAEELVSVPIRREKKDTICVCNGLDGGI